ncbi:helix-turn-helix domain-containing protein [Streptomyces sp. NPDC017979]|uniref:AraC-like ligand-binding domain-containing protein n=1 Tax=Streptomyces sp. NPDC017979 TaxID=3365024 RepID=UPI0037ADA007
MPVADRGDRWHDVIASTVAPTRLAIEDAATFRARADTLHMGGLTASWFSHTTLRSWRTPALIRRSDPGHYCLALMQKGSMWVTQRRNEAEFGAGEAVLFDSSHPLVAGTGLRHRGAEVLILSLPRQTLVLPQNGLDRLIATPLDARRGMGAVLTRFVASLAEEADACTGPELQRLGGMAVELATAYLAQRIGAFEALPARSRAGVLRERIDAFIDGSLGDADLSPRTVAEHHGISLRSLYALFEPRGEGVAASIRRRRLELCRADLARPALRHRPIHAIAAHRGFGNAEVFSRAFKAAYGIGPRAFRQQAQRAAGAGLLPAYDVPP